MSLHKLILAPANPEQVPHDVDGLVTALGRMGFIGAPFQLAGRTHYLPGERFLDHISFLGCSPLIALEPPEGTQADPGIHADKFCHVGLWYAGEWPVFLAGLNTSPPRCPKCRSPAEHWQEMIGVWQSVPSTHQWTCPACTEQSRPYELDWRQSAGFSRLFVEVWGVHAAEAVPGELLLSTLKRSTGGRWVYFYIQVD